MATCLSESVTLTRAACSRRARPTQFGAAVGAASKTMSKRDDDEAARRMAMIEDQLRQR
jgi:hypothetical protein